MNTKLTPLTLAALLLVVPATQGADTDSYESLRPTGRLDISKSLVRTGEKPNLDWEITYPLTTVDVVDIRPDDSLEAKTKSLMEVRMAGAAFQVGQNHTNVLLQAKSGSDSWQTLYNAPDYRVDASQVLMSKVVEEGERIDFSARASKGSRRGWYTSRNTLESDNTLIALKNGDTIPNFTPAYNQGDIEGFLSSYIEPAGDGTYKAVLGPRDVIYLFELYATNPNSNAYDMQDIVAVVTFKDIPE